MRIILILSFFLVSTLSLASTLDKLTSNEVLGMPLSKLESIFLKENCPNKECEFRVYESENKEKLNQSQRLALWLYTTWMFDDINPALYHGTLTGSQVGFVRIMDEALKKVPSQKAIVYRGTSKHSPQPVNSIVELKGYTSTSLNMETALEFVRNRLMIIETRSGKNIQDFSQAEYEQELLLPRGVKLKVMKVETKRMQVSVEGMPALVEILHLKEI